MQDGVHPFLNELPFLKSYKKRHGSAGLQAALLDPAAISAHAAAVEGFVLHTLERADAVCLAEVGAPVVAALQVSNIRSNVPSNVRSKV